MIRIVIFQENVSVNASRECGSDGSWAPITYYGDCLCNSTEACHDLPPALEISIIIYLIGIYIIHPV